MAKRIFDLVGATLALLLLWPVMLALALWIKLDSPGPVFFRQERVGRHGLPFRMYKFRTMFTGAVGLPLTAVDDPRVTAAGAFLRRTRLDETPQFIDVLLGRMSLVGPRPEVARYVALYPSALREVALSVRPGMTDPAALAHLDEARLLAAAADPEQAYIETILPTKVAQAAAYAQQATLASDVVVLARTVRALWQRRSARA
jgi:lipopolysaccharide/colanic/teichoic acid biosynthesis glycosyltransferase